MDSIGVTRKTARTIERYRSKVADSGNQATWIRYGEWIRLWLRRLKPYVTIKPDATQASQNYASAWRKAEGSLINPRIIDINLADSGSLGITARIGPSLAREDRIVP